MLPQANHGEPPARGNVVGMEVEAVTERVTVGETVAAVGVVVEGEGAGRVGVTVGARVAVGDGTVGDGGSVGSGVKVRVGTV